MAVPEDLQKEIAQHLRGSFADLAVVALASRALAASTRPVLFATVRITSTLRLLQLNDLLCSSRCTIPHIIDTLVIHLDLPPAGESFLSVRESIILSYTILDHFTIRSYVSISLPYLLSRTLDWDLLGAHSASIRRFVLSGVHGSLFQTVTAVSNMRALESLTLDASWKDDRLPEHWNSTPCTFPPSLKEICFSASALHLMQWMVSTNVGMMDLHVVRMKIDGRTSTLESFTSAPLFMEKFGAKVSHVYFWLEDTDSDEVCSDIRQCLRMDLFQLELFFPSIALAQEAERLANEVVCPDVRPAVVHIFSEDVIEDETAFRGTPVPCLQSGCVESPCSWWNGQGQAHS